MIKDILLVGLGGGVGSVFRFLTSRMIFKLLPNGWPVGTFIVNIVGCFLIGLLVGLSFKHTWIDSNGRSLLIIGFCGGFTTFSTFAIENFNLYQAGNYSVLAVYIISSLLIGCIAVWAGLYIAK